MYNYEIENERTDAGNDYYGTRVNLKATNGFILHYYMAWTEGEAETGGVTTPYSKL